MRVKRGEHQGDDAEIREEAIQVTGAEKEMKGKEKIDTLKAGKNTGSDLRKMNVSWR